LPLYNVMHMTGHKSLSMVQRYAHLAPDFQENAIEVLDSQRAPFGHNLGTGTNAVFSKEDAKLLKKLVPPVGFEPTTPALRMRSSYYHTVVRSCQYYHFLPYNDDISCHV